MMAPPKRSKKVTAKEIKSGRISFPASARDAVLPDVAPNSQTALTMVDEKGDSHEVVIKVRNNGTKQEIMSKGGRKFVSKRKLVAGAILDFAQADSPGQFKVKVRDGPQLGDLSVTLQPPILRSSSYDPVAESLTGEMQAVLGLLTLSAQTQPPVADNFPTSGLASAKKVFRSSIGRSDYPPGEPPKPTPMAMELGTVFSIDLNHAPVEHPPPSTTSEALGLGSPLLANMPPGFDFSINSKNTQAAAPPLAPELSLSMSYNHELLQQPLAVGRIKAEAQEVDSPYGEWCPDHLRLSLEPTFLRDHPKFYEKKVEQESNYPKPLETAAVFDDLQELKPPTALAAAKSGFSSAFLAYSGRGENSASGSNGGETKRWIG